MSWGSFMSNGVYDSVHKLALLVVLLFVAVIILKAYQSVIDGRGDYAITKASQNDPLTLHSERYSPWVEVELEGGELGYVHQRYIAES